MPKRISRRFVNGANRTVEEFKEELLSEDVEEARCTVEGFKEELRFTGRPPTPSANTPRPVVDDGGFVGQRDQQENYG
jgi:hypothetical protein